MWYVYILLCEDQSLYTGISNNPEKRYSAHKNGKGAKYTRSHKPLRIIFTEPHPTIGKALKREKQIKKWPKDKKLQLAAKIEEFIQ